MYVREIFLTKKNVTSEDWLKLINIISQYNGFFKKWKIIINIHKKNIRFFIKSKYKISPTINGLDSFLFKDSELPNDLNYSYSMPYFPRFGSNIIDIVNDFEIHRKGIAFTFEIEFVKVSEKIKSKAFFFVKKNNIIKRYFIIFCIAEKFLSVDFEGNKRYFYNKAPKYFNIKNLLPVLSKNNNNSLLSVDTFPYLNKKYYLNPNMYNFDKHSIIIGSSGCGKSKLISLLINNIYKDSKLKNNYKFVVIDPHASLESDIGGLGNVIDFSNYSSSIDLFSNNNQDIVSTCEVLIDLFKNLMDDLFNSKLERVLRHSIHLLLVNNCFNFNTLRNLLLDLEFRNTLINDSKDKLPDSVIRFFLSDFNDLKTKSYGEAISPIIGFIDEMEMVPVFNLEKSNDNLLSAINDNFLTLFSLDITKLGNKVTKMIAGLIMQQLLNIVQTRSIKEHIIFIIDEVSILENNILCRYLSEARKYNLSLILAGQYFNQISTNLKNAIFANVVNYYVFRVSKIDAEILVNNFNMSIPLDDSLDYKIKLLTELNDRECVMRIQIKDKLLPAFKAFTLDYKSIPRIKKNISSIIKNKSNNLGSMNFKNNFSLDTDISLKDILKINSTSRKVVK